MEGEPEVTSRVQFDTTPSSSTVGYGHVAVIPPRRVTGIPRLDQVWLDRFAQVNSTDVADKIGPLYAMSPDIGPLYQPIRRLVGQALTVKAVPGDSLAVHGALSMVQPGDVIVVDWRGYDRACAGGSNILKLPAERGLRGVVIDGAWRDLDESQEVDFPIFGRARNPHSPPKRRPGEINVPVACGGVVVEPGDLVVADSEGVVIVPRKHVAAVWDAVDSAPAHPWTAAEIETAYDKRTAAYQGAFAAASGHEAVWTE